MPGFDPAIAERVFRIGMPSALDVCLTPRLLARIKGEAPGIDIVVRPMSPSQVAAQLDEDAFDLAVGVFGPLKSWHAQSHLARRRFLCLWHPAQVRARRPISLERYVAEPHVLTSFTGDRRGVVDEALERIGRRRRVLLASADFASAAMYLASTRAIATLPEYAARTFAAALGLVTSPPPVELPAIELACAWHLRTMKDPAHAWFRALVIDEGKKA